MPVVFRIGNLLFSPHILLVPLGAAFFLVIGYKKLYPALTRSRAESVLALVAAAIPALAGSWLVNDHADPSAVVRAQGSFGGYWGALAGVALWALVRRKPVLAAGNAIAPAILAGGAVARLGCLFGGCCHGPGGLPLIGPWPLYDILALVGALVAGLRLEKRRGDGTLLSFLLVYGVLRFGLEFARPAPEHALGLTSGQWFAAVQALAGVALLVLGKAQSAATQDENT